MGPTRASGSPANPGRTAGSRHGGRLLPRNMAQWLGTVEGTENLTAMMPAVTPIDGWIWGNQYVNGAYQLALNHAWGLSTSNRTAQPIDQYNWSKLLTFVPLKEMDRVAKRKGQSVSSRTGSAIPLMTSIGGGFPSR